MLSATPLQAVPDPFTLSCTWGTVLDQIQGLLFTISSAFLLPVLTAVLAAFIYATYLVGQFLSEALDHRSNRANLKELYSAKPTVDRFLSFPWKTEMASFQRAVQAHIETPALLDKKVVDLENRMRRRVDRLGIMSRTGPILGLVGTLIPLQPALAGLASGDMQAVGANLLIGFTTTVIGLLVGGACYAISVVMRNWYQQDVTEIHFLMAQWAPPADENQQRARHIDESLEPLAVETIPISGRLESAKRAVRGHD